MKIEELKMSKYLKCGNFIKKMKMNCGGNQCKYDSNLNHIVALLIG